MHLHNKNIHIVLMSPTEPEISDSLRKTGFTVIPTQCVKELRNNEQYHADMQMCIIKDTAFVPENCTEIAKAVNLYGYNVVPCKSLSRLYPDNVSLNVALIGDSLYCKESALAKEISGFCAQNNISIINVNQGYTNCSTLILNENAIITADNTICTAAMKNNINVLKISPGNIYLQDADYGFIGGCSGVVGDTVYFFGDINTHPEAEQIIKFMANQGMNYVSLTDGMLKDIGGFVVLR